MQRTAVSVPSPLSEKSITCRPTIAQADEKRGRGTLSTGALNPILHHDSVVSLLHKRRPSGEHVDSSEILSHIVLL